MVSEENIVLEGDLCRINQDSKKYLRGQTVDAVSNRSRLSLIFDIDPVCSKMCGQIISCSFFDAIAHSYILNSNVNEDSLSSIAYSSILELTFRGFS